MWPEGVKMTQPNLPLSRLPGSSGVTVSFEFFPPKTREVA
jgi:hypothetical protein